MGWSLERALRELHLDHADVLLLGLWNKPVPARIIDAGRRLKERGPVRFLACSSHNRALIAQMVAGNDFDVIHFRYNAAHTGAESDTTVTRSSFSQMNWYCFNTSVWLVPPGPHPTSSPLLPLRVHSAQLPFRPPRCAERLPVQDHAVGPSATSSLRGAE